MKFITNIFICLSIALTTNLICFSTSVAQVTTEEEVVANDNNTEAANQAQGNIQDGSQTETVEPFTTAENY